MRGGRVSKTEAQDTLESHLAGMAEAATTIERVLGAWAQEYCRVTMRQAVEGDAHRTKLLQSAGTYQQLYDEASHLSAEMPERIASGLRASAWRHAAVGGGEAAANVMGDLDYGTWPHTGHRMPPAYEPVIERELNRVTQLLRKYGYRPERPPESGRRRYPAPPAAIPTMEAYYRMAARLPELVAAAEEERKRIARESSVSGWDT